jgi:magnesium chelatase subunit I
MYSAPGQIRSRGCHRAFEVNAARDPAVRASCIEFVLAGLHATERISRIQSHGKTVYDTGGFR